MTWDLNELTSQIKLKRGRDAYLTIKPYLNSVVERLEFARFHYHEARECLNHYMIDEFCERELLHLAAFNHGEDSELEGFHEARFKARAHVLACVQSLHAVSDILGHVIYHALNLNQVNRERDINIYKVRDRVKEFPDFKSLHSLVDALVRHDEYKYLAGLVNHSKHRSIVGLQMNFNLLEEGNEVKELIFPEFSYNNTHHERRKIFDFLSREFYRQNELVIKIGCELNVLVRETT